MVLSCRCSESDLVESWKLLYACASSERHPWIACDPWTLDEAALGVRVLACLAMGCQARMSVSCDLSERHLLVMACRMSPDAGTRSVAIDLTAAQQFDLRPQKVAFAFHPRLEGNLFGAASPVRRAAALVSGGQGEFLEVNIDVLRGREELVRLLGDLRKEGATYELSGLQGVCRFSVSVLKAV